MGSLRHPVGDQPPQVYWFRRALVLIVLVLVGIGVWLLVSALTGDGSDAPADGADPTTSPTPTASTSAQVAPDDPSRPCTSADVTLATTPTPESPTIGTEPAFDVAITHTGTSPCTLSTDADGTELAISSGNDQYYSTTWCPEDPGFESTSWILQEGDTEALQVVWPGIWQDEDCGGPVSDVRPGTYNAAVSIGGITAEVVPFSMVE